MFSLKCLLTEAKCTALFVIDPLGFDKEAVAAFEYVSSGVLRIERRTTSTETVHFISMPFSKTTFTSMSLRPVKWEEGAMVIQSTMDAVSDKEDLMSPEERDRLAALTEENVSLRNEVEAAKLALDKLEALLDGLSPEQAAIARGEVEGSRADDKAVDMAVELEGDAGDIREVLEMIDEMFTHLPENVLNEFLESEIFKKYERLVEKYVLSGN